MMRDTAVQGFDEYMNLVLDEAEEVSMKRKTRKPVGAPQGRQTLGHPVRLS